MSVVGCTCSSVYWSVEMKKILKSLRSLQFQFSLPFCVTDTNTPLIGKWKNIKIKKKKTKKMYNGCIEIICNCINGATVIKLNN